MIRLFDKDETNFDSNGLGVLDSEIKENVVEEKMNGIYNFDFAYLSKGEHASQLEGDMIIKAPTPDGDQLFRVYKVTKNIGFLEVNCYHIFYDLAGNFIEDINIVSQSGQAAITHFGTGLQYATRFKFVSNIVGTNSARMVRLNAVQALLDSSQDNSFLSRWGGEIKRDNFTVYMNDVRGNDKGFKIRHGKNLTGYEANIDYSSVVTRIMPYGYNGLMLPEKYVDSPLRDKYAFTRIKKIEYTNIKAIDPDASSNDESAVPLEEAYELLRQAAALEYSVNKVNIPTSNFKVTFKNLADTKEYADFKALEKVEPWDYVTVIADNLDIKSRMISYKYDAITKAYKEVELGNYVPSFTDIGSKVDHATNLANQANDTANTAAESANGKNSNYHGPSEPSRPVDGDLWYKKNGDKTELWQYDGKSVPPGWKLVVDDATGEEVRQNVGAAQKEAEEAKKTANESVAAANDAVAKAGFANDTAEEAKSDAAAAQKDATGALSDAQNALTNSSSAQADSAQARKDSAAAAADASSAKNDAATALTDAKKALTDSGSAMADSTQARKDSATAIKDAADSLTSAKDAIDKVGNLTTSVTSQFTTVNNELKSKVNQTDYDKLKGTVTSQQTEINQNASGIKLKADKSYTDTINNSVVKNTSSIGLLNNQIALTVSKAELNNTLSSYATQTWTQGQIKTTADQINLSVSQVQSNLDNMQVAGVNYLRNSNFEFGNANWRMWTPGAIPTDAKVTFNKISGDSDWPQNTNGYVKIEHPTANGVKYGIAQDHISVVGDSDYVVSFECAGSAPLTIEWGDGVTTPYKDIVINPVSHKRIQVTFHTPKGASFMNFYIGFGGNQTGTNWISRIMMSQGNKSIDWSPNPSEYTSEVQFSQLQVTVNGIQGTVQNKADQSQVTQLADQITSVIGGMGQKNLITNTEFNDLSEWEFARPELWRLGTNQYDGYKGSNTLFFNGASNTSWTSARSNAIPVGEGEAISASAILFATGSIDVATPKGAVQIEVDFYDTIDGPRREFYGKKFNNDDPYAKQLLKLDGIKVPASRKFVRFFVQVQAGAQIVIAHPMLVKDTFAGEYQPNTVSESQITQLQDDINLRVQKGDVINQINISPESILIAGEKVHITGQTSIDNAVIKDAMIADIKADKITAGTLNAANVNVINLNANNITTGTIKGANLSLNLNTGEVVFQHGRIHSTSNNVDVNIDQGYLSTASNNTRVMLKEGQLQLVQPTIFDNSKDPYLQISNSVGGASFNGANIIARDYLVLANRANAGGYFNDPIGQETFAGLAVGKSDRGGWHETKLGGAERGVLITGGKAFTLWSVLNQTPAIRVGSMDPSRRDRVSIDGSYVHIPSAYWRTASGSANLIVARDGALVRSTSASKYKTDIIRTNVTDYGDKLLNLPTATWTDIAETKRYRDDPANQIKPTRNFGMIAEDLAEAGLEMLVVRGLDGELEGINYDRIGPALIPVIAKLKNEVEILKRKLEEPA